jgi:hypothetical protein
LIYLHILGIYLSHTKYMTGTYSLQTIHILHVIDIPFFLQGFRAWHQARPDPTPRDMPEDHRPDPRGKEDFELHDQLTLIDALKNGVCKERQPDCLPACQIRVSVMAGHGNARY